MATVINNPSSDSGAGAVTTGVILGALIVIGLLVYGFRNVGNPATTNPNPTTNTNIDIKLPSADNIIGTGTSQ